MRQVIESPDESGKEKEKEKRECATQKEPCRLLINIPINARALSAGNSCNYAIRDRK